jgi:hypothetical protein
MITKELVEDAFIHLEDHFMIWSSLFTFRTFDENGEAKNGSALYDIFKIEPDLIKYFYLYSHITLDTKERIILNRKSFYKFDEWNKVNSEISTAIKRITKDTSTTQISTDKESDFVIEITLSKKFEVENIDRLVVLCRKFNGLFAPSLIIYPQFHYQKGVVIYLREIPPKDKKRFEIFNGPVVGSIFSDFSVEKFLSENFKFVKKFDTKEQVLQSNEFLKQKTSALDEFIIFELEPLEFNIIK